MVRITDFPSQIADKKYAQAVTASLYCNGSQIISPMKIADFYIDTIKYLLSKNGGNAMGLNIDGIVEIGTPNDENHVYKKISDTHCVNVNLTSRAILSNLKLAFEYLTQNSLLNMNDYEVDFFFRDVDGNDDDFDIVDFSENGENLIIYGIPGCGKSHYLNTKILGFNPKTKKYCGDFEDENIIRTTFYPDYSNADFIGQVKPLKHGEDVDYPFIPGPFTIALEKALLNEKKMIALVIEEINRGNASAIFGDIFQLLDRDENGKSEYGVNNIQIINYLKNESSIPADKKSLINKIFIPKNMYIFATMNTSDQNVFKLDTAYKRRWNFKRLTNYEAESDCPDFNVPGTQIKWKCFVDSINSKIAMNPDLNGDRQIGYFFVKNSISKEEFANKVLEYLYNDVYKYADKSDIFKITDDTTFDSIYHKYINGKINDLFADDLFPEINPAEESQSETNG